MNVPVVLFALIFYGIVNFSSSTNIQLSPNSIELVEGQQSQLNLTITDKNTTFWRVEFSFVDESMKKTIDKLPIDPIKPLEIDNRTINYVNLVNITAQRPGQIYVILNITNLDDGSHINVSHSVHSKVSVMLSRSLHITALVIGWIYFLAWTISFYPQVWHNFKRKSVVGLNFDFLALNLLGFICYSAFNLSLFFNSEIQQQYREKQHSFVIPVEINDVFFCIHACVITLVTICQCFIYERNGQRVSYLATGIISVLLVLIFIVIVLAATHVITWLSMLYYLSYAKLVISLIKYVPQAYFNCRRKSTLGWSIENILLDFTGGTLSILQMFMVAKNFDQFGSIFGNPSKLLLGLFSVLFDCFFMLQHFVLFRNQSEQEELAVPVENETEEDQNNPAPEQPLIVID